MEEDPVKQFTAITGASEQTARACLEQTGGDVEEAIEQFYANGGQEAPAAAPSAAARPPAAAQPGARRVPSGNIRGFADLTGEEEEEEEEDDDNEYYAGGAKSGVAVRGGPREGNRDRVADLFDGARRAGAEEGRPEDLQPSSGGGGFQAFTGGARRLAGGDSPAAAAAAPRAPGRPRPEQRRVNVTFYRNGIFTVDDGEPRNVMDPANLPFMDAIRQGRCPAELDPGDPNVMVDVFLVRKDEDYTPPARPKVVAFAGTGRKLGGDGDASTSAAAAAAGAAPAPGPNAGAPMAAWEGADEAQPTTSIQLRLADGSRMVAKFNLSHTVGDIRRFIHALRPQLTGTYQLVTAFPPQQLNDDSATIQAAGLANSVIIQKA